MFLTRFVLELKLLFNCFLTGMSRKKTRGLMVCIFDQHEQVECYKHEEMLSVLEGRENRLNVSVISMKKCCRCQREGRAR